LSNSNVFDNFIDFNVGSTRFFAAASAWERRASSQRPGTTACERFDAVFFAIANVFASFSSAFARLGGGDFSALVWPGVASLPNPPKPCVLPEFSRQSFRSAAASGRFPSLNAISNRFQRDFLFSVDIFLLRLVKLFKLAFRSTDAVEFASFFLNETCRNRRGRREARLRPRKIFRKFLSFRRRSGDIFRDDGIVATAARRFGALLC